MPQPPENAPDLAQLRRQVVDWARELGFQQVGFSGVELDDDEVRLLEWLAQERHGEMAYMQRHGTLRSRPAELVPGTLSVITLRMDYWPQTAAAPWPVIGDPDLGYVSRYALGRDYHKLIRARLQKLAHRMESGHGPFGYRVFTDSAPLMEKPLARNGGLGWIGKHTNLINSQAGSWFFLGELLTDIPFEPDAADGQSHCGSCRACMDICPTDAIPAPYQLDARRCISYLTIELRGSIPEDLRPLIGNRIYGCDDCQLVCPWNKFATATVEPDFAPRHELDRSDLTDLFRWTEQEFLQRLEGNAIRRIGHDCWLRNIAVALGNGTPRQAAINALRKREQHPSDMVREHVRWALERLTGER